MEGELMPRIDLTPRYFHRFVSSHGQLYLSLVPGRDSRVRSIIKFRSNLQAHYNSLQYRGTAVLSKKIPLLTELLQGQVRIILSNIYSAPKNNRQQWRKSLTLQSNNPSRFLPTLHISTLDFQCLSPGDSSHCGTTGSLVFTHSKTRHLDCHELLWKQFTATANRRGDESQSQAPSFDVPKRRQARQRFGPLILTHLWLIITDYN